MVAPAAIANVGYGDFGTSETDTTGAVDQPSPG
jgi:hypothetical protein